MDIAVAKMAVAMQVRHQRLFSVVMRSPQAPSECLGATNLSTMLSPNFR
jgi:hypothetical protein